MTKKDFARILAGIKSKPERLTKAHLAAIKEQLLAEKLERAELRAAYNAQRKADRRHKKALGRLKKTQRKTDRLLLAEIRAHERAQAEQELAERRVIAEETLQRLRDHSISRDMFMEMLEDEGFDKDESYEILNEY